MTTSTPATPAATDTSSTSSTYTVAAGDVGDVQVSVTDRGSGQPVLLLHGGAGPQSMAGLADLLAAGDHARVFTPTHPGFGGTARPDTLSTVPALARVYVALLEQLDLDQVTVVGNSIGGWVAAEMALLGSPRIGRLVLIDAVGIDVPDHPVADFFSLTLDQVSQLTFHDPVKFRNDPTAMPPAQQAAMAGNRATLAVYAGSPSMVDPTLRDRLAAATVPTLVLWGDSDRIVDVDYGRAYAAAIPGARFHLLTDTGHVPQIETPQQVADAIRTEPDGPSTAPGQPRWSTQYEADTTLSPAQIWAALRDLHTGTKLSERSNTYQLHGPFAVGTDMSVTPQGQEQPLRSTIIEMVDGHAYADQTQFNGLLLQDRHTLTALPAGGTRVTHILTILGPTALTVGSQLGPRISEDYPVAMDDLLAAARTRPLS